MEHIQKPELLKHKSIKEVYIDNLEQHIVFIFDDNSYFHVYGCSGYDGEHEIDYLSDIHDDLKVECGIMSEEEYYKIVEEREKKSREYIEQQEYKNYLRLKEKYEAK